MGSLLSTTVRERPLKAVVLAAGEGTRLRPLTWEQPKPMLPIGGRPLPAHTLEGLRRVVVESHTYVRGRDLELVRGTFEQSVSHGVGEPGPLARGSGQQVLLRCQIKPHDVRLEPVAQGKQLRLPATDRAVGFRVASRSVTAMRETGAARRTYVKPLSPVALAQDDHSSRTGPVDANRPAGFERVAGILLESEEARPGRKEANRLALGFLGVPAVSDKTEPGDDELPFYGVLAVAAQLGWLCHSGAVL